MKLTDRWGNPVTIVRRCAAADLARSHLEHESRVIVRYEDGYTRMVHVGQLRIA